jgi:hypothetical protein
VIRQLRTSGSRSPNTGSSEEEHEGPTR